MVLVLLKTAFKLFYSLDFLVLLYQVADPPFGGTKEQIKILYAAPAGG